MGLIRYLLIIIVLCFVLNCSSIQMGDSQFDKPILFNEVYSERTIPFKIESEYIYWFGINMNNSKTISDLLINELKKFPEAKGIMKLKIKYFEAYHDSPQSLFINPLTFIGSQVFAGVSTIILLNKKSIELAGEIYF